MGWQAGDAARAGSAASAREVEAAVLRARNGGRAARPPLDSFARKALAERTVALYADVLEAGSPGARG